MKNPRGEERIADALTKSPTGTVLGMGTASSWEKDAVIPTLVEEEHAQIARRSAPQLLGEESLVDEDDDRYTRAAFYHG